MDNSKIAILSTVNNFTLYRKSSLLYPSNINSYVIDGRNGMFGIDSIMYMMRKFKNKDIDWVILMDEDVLLIEPKGLFPLIEYMSENDFITCGVRDGGMLPERSGNPYVINPFFSILNLRKIKSLWNRKKVLKEHYILNDEFEDDLSHLIYDYNVLSMSEPYYCFYFWLKRIGEKALYLDTYLPFKEDSITNLVLDHEKKPLLYHTWFSREYGDKRGRHTDRIDSVFKKFDFSDTKSSSPFIFKDSLFPLKRRKRRLIKNLKKRFGGF